MLRNVYVKINRIMLKLYKINIFVQYVSETILQGLTLALSILTLQRYEKKLRLPNIFS